MPELLQLMIAPFVASMLLVAMLSYLGIHIIARGVIFVDLALAQMAALGVTFGLLFHVSPDAPLSYAFALGFTTLGALVFALTREDQEDRRVPQEAIIGIVYIVATAAAVLIADRTPAGGEAVKDVLVGSLLWVSWPTIGRIAIVYAVVGVIQWLLRNRFLTISLKEDVAEERGWSIRGWDFLFYALFGVVITLAVPLAGILLVFTLLVVPAVVAFQFTRRTATLVMVSWGVSALAVISGLAVSFHFDLPTGPLMVCMFGLLLLVAWVLRKVTGGPGATVSQVAGPSRSPSSR